MPLQFDEGPAGCEAGPYTFSPRPSNLLCGYSFSTFTAQTLNSGALAMLSSAAIVSQLLLPSWKWNGIHVSPGFVFPETRAVDSDEG